MAIYVHESDELRLSSTTYQRRTHDEMDGLTPSLYREVKEVLIWHKTSKR